MISLAILNQEQEFFCKRPNSKYLDFNKGKKNQNYCVRKKISELLTK